MTTDHSVPPTAPPGSAPPPTAPVPVVTAPRHTVVEDVLGLVTGTLLASFGLFLLRSTSAVTGGVAGIALVLGYATGWSFGVLFFVINVPFFLLALRTMGLSFSIRTLIAISLLSGFAFLHPAAFGAIHVERVYGIALGDLLIGVGMLILFRHHASLGGINILALLLQKRFGWRAGYVQMAVDVTIIALSLTVVPPLNVALSAAGAVLLNIVLAMNHRPGRYLGT